MALDFDQFVDRAHGRGVAGHGKFSAYAKSVYGGSGGHEGSDFGFVQIATGHDFGIRHTSGVEDAADILRGGEEVAAIDADAPEGSTEATDFASTFEDVIGIEQLYGPVTQQLLQLAEGFGFGLKRHYPGVGGGAHHGNAIAKTGEGVAGARASAYKRGPRAQGAGFGGVGAAGAELHHVPALRGVGDAGGFRCHQGLEGES